MGLACRIVYSGNTALVYNEDGSPSESYQGILDEVGNQSKALELWATSFLPEFKTYIGELNTNDQITVKEIGEFYNAQNMQDSSGLNDQDKRQAEEFMKVTGYERLSDLRVTLQNIFRQNGFTELNESAALRSGMYSVQEVKELSIDKIDTLLNNIDKTLLEGEIETVINQKKPTYKNSNYKTVFETFEPVSEEDVYQDLAGRLEVFNSNEEFYKKVQELPYPDFVDKFYADEAFANRVISKFEGMRKIPVLAIVDGQLVQDNSSTFNTLSSTLKTDVDFLSLEADIDFISGIDENIWIDEQDTVKRLLKKTEEEFAKQSIDIVGISENIGDQASIVNFLTSLNNLLRLVENNTVTSANIYEFSKTYDDFFGVEESTSTVKLAENYEGLTIVQLSSELSDSDLFDNYGLIKIEEGIYHKIQPADNKTELYEYLYNEVIEERLSIETQLGTNQQLNDPRNKIRVLEDITKYVVNRETGMDVLNRELLSLNQLVFNHLPVPVVDVSSNMMGVSNIRSNTEHLKTNFISDFYEYVLSEKVKDSLIYRKVLSKLNFTDRGISSKDQIESLEGVKFKDELLDYIRLSKDGGMKYLVENINTDIIEELLYLNNPQLLQEYKGQPSFDGGYALTEPNSQNIIKVAGRLYKKMLETDTTHLYAPVINGVDNTYYQTEVETSFDLVQAKEIIRKYDKAFGTEMNSKDAGVIFEKSQLESTIVEDLNKQETVEEFKNSYTPVLDSRIEVLSLYDSNQVLEIYNKIDNCG